MQFFCYTSDLWQTLNSQQRRGAVILLLLMLIGMLLEMMGVGLIFPLLALIVASPEEMAQYTGLAQNIGLHSLVNEGNLLYMLTIVIFIVYTFKTGFLMYLAWRQMSYVFDIQASLSRNLLNNYINKPYLFHLEKNTSELIRNIITETQLFTHTGLIAAMTLYTELFVLTGLLSLALAIEPLLTTLLSLLVFSFALLFLFFTQQSTKKMSEERQQLDKSRLMWAQQSMSGIKDIITSGSQSYFLNKYEAPNMLAAKIGCWQLTISQMPRLMLEWVAILGLCIYLIYNQSIGNDIAGILPFLGMFAAAAFRLLPSLSRMVTAFQNMRFAFPVIRLIKTELNSAELKHLSPLSIADFRSLRFEKVDVRYTHDRPPALQNINIQINQYDCIGIIGESGAGKTTFIDTILGLLPANTGKIYINDQEINTTSSEWISLIGYVPQSVYLVDDTIKRNIAFGVEDALIDIGHVEKCLELANLSKFVNGLPYGIEESLGEFGSKISGGQRQRIGIARALYRNPKILIFDEVTSALDEFTENEIIQTIGNLKGIVTILLITHNIKNIIVCNRLLEFKKGAVSRDEVIEGSIYVR